LLSAAEATLVNELGKLLLHHLFDLGDSLLESFLRSAGDMEVERGVLETSVSPISLPYAGACVSYCWGGHALVGVVVSSGGDILVRIKASTSSLQTTRYCGKIR
jgi:hypothetical protein